MLKDINPLPHFDPEDWGRRRRGKTGQSSFLGESFGTEVKKLIYSFASLRGCCKIKKAAISVHWLRADGTLILGDQYSLSTFPSDGVVDRLLFLSLNQRFLFQVFHQH